MRVLMVALVACLPSLIGCGPPAVGPLGTAVGDACTTGNQCQTLCYLGSHFPGGLCSRRCNADSDCPAGTTCISDDNSAICAIKCSLDADCYGYGRGYACVSTTHVGSGGDTASVCRAP
jgi:hypothetical protein